MISTRRYQWMVGGIALVMVIAFSVVLYTHGRHTAPGIRAGAVLPRFVAPLAVGGPDASANVDPVCDTAAPAKGGLNVCNRRALVLDLFALNGQPCVNSVDALQRVADAWRRSGAPSGPRRPLALRRYTPRITFAAVAAGASQSQTRALVSQHHWRIPVAYDPTGAVGELYDVTICPMIEIAGANGRVRRLLIGERYEKPAAIADAVRRALG